MDHGCWFCLLAQPSQDDSGDCAEGFVACSSSSCHLILSVTGLKSAIILEDDIDFEWNIEKILRKQWPALPDDWDIIYLGA
jgi:hypothetical protein